MNWEKYLVSEKQCNCGKVHSCDIGKIIIEENAFMSIPKLLKEGKYKEIYLLTDYNTQEIAGNQIKYILSEQEIVFQEYSFLEKNLLPNEDALELLEESIGNECDLLIGIGAGTINDICKYFASKRNIPFFIVATAPSMDGYASNVSALLLNNAKATVETKRPTAIIADTKMLAEAPLEMIAAGVGDMLGKYVCLMDWQISNIVTGEYYCEYVKKIMESALEQINAAVESLSMPTPKAIEKLMEGLTLSGIAMSYLGNSRPASGSEHHLSHFWEMMFLQQGKEAVLHGAKVGVGTVVTLKLYEKLENYLKNPEDIETPLVETEKWMEEIRYIYGEAAEEVITLEEKTKKNTIENIEKRKRTLLAKKEEVLQLIQKLPKAEEIERVLNSLQAPSSPEQIGVDQKMVLDAIYYAKELRNRYGILQINYDLNNLLMGEISK